MSSTDHDDEQAPAVLRAGGGTDAWEKAARLQQGAVPDHGEFYALAAEVVSTLAALEDLTRVLGPQVAGYVASQRTAGRAVYDDSRTLDPAVRLAEAVAALDGTRLALGAAYQSTNAFWSAIGHIGSTFDPASVPAWASAPGVTGVRS